MAQIGGEAVDDLGAPAVRLMALADRPADLPIQADQFPIDRQRGPDLRGADAFLQVAEQLLVALGDKRALTPRTLPRTILSHRLAPSSRPPSVVSLSSSSL